MGDCLLEVRGVTKRFPGVVALSGVDLQVRRCRGSGADRGEWRGEKHLDENPCRGAGRRMKGSC